MFESPILGNDRWRQDYIVESAGAEQYRSTGDFRTTACAVRRQCRKPESAFRRKTEPPAAAVTSFRKSSRPRGPKNSGEGSHSPIWKLTLALWQNATLVSRHPNSGARSMAI
jgi:hypothetical protein